MRPQNLGKIEILRGSSKVIFFPDPCDGMRLGKCAGVVLCLATAGMCGLLAAEVENIRTVSGNVVLVKSISKQVVVASGSEETVSKNVATFQADDKTKFENLENLSGLKVNDPVLVTYADNGKGIPKISRIEKN